MSTYNPTAHPAEPPDCWYCGSAPAISPCVVSWRTDDTTVTDSPEAVVCADCVLKAHRAAERRDDYADGFCVTAVDERMGVAA